MSRLLRAALLTLLAAVLTALLVAPGGAAYAHDQLVGSDPEDGATVEAPDAIVLTFSGAISDLGAQVVVEDSSGQPLTEGQPRVDGTELHQDLADLAAGTYTALWRVTSADGHPISGELTFTVTAGPDGSADEETTDVATAPTGDDATTPAPSTTTASSTVDDTPGSTTDGVRDGEEGLPVWAWLVVGVAVLGLAALLATTWGRGRR